MGETLTQVHYKFGTNIGNVSDPDNITFGALDTSLTEQTPNEQIQLRIQVVNSGDADTSSYKWQLYYNTTNDSSDGGGATKINNTVSAAVHLVDDVKIANDTRTTTSNTVCDNSEFYTWENGYFADVDEAPNFVLQHTHYTDFQFNIEFAQTAKGNTYYFFLRYYEYELDGYSVAPAVAVTSAHTTFSQYVDTDVSPGGNGHILNPYASLSEWHTASVAMNNDLTGDDTNMIVYCKGEAPDTGGNVDITGWTTDSINNILITTYGDGIHNGTEGTGYVFRPTASGSGIELGNDYITIDGIEIYGSNSLSNPLIGPTGTTSNTTVKNCILHGKRGYLPNIGYWNNTTGTNYLYNCFIYDIASVLGAPAGIRCNAGTLYCYNNTVVNMDSTGIRLVAGTLVEVGVIVIIILVMMLLPQVVLMIEQIKHSLL